MKKKILSLLLAITLLFGTNTFIYASETPAYEITDEYVRIDYEIYEIEDNTIQYDGKIYENVDYTLVTYEEDGTPVRFVLPVEQNKITDPEQIEELNQLVSSQDGLMRGLTDNAVNLEYTSSVPQGQYIETTPAFNIIYGKYHYNIILQLNNLPLLAKNEFQIRFLICNNLGEWHTDIMTHDFSIVNWVKYQNWTHWRYGIFVITNLYDDPSPAYNYRIFYSEI